MSDAAVLDAPEQLPGQDELFPEPAAKDSAPRVTKAPEVPPDPDAPFGWMVDPVTKERRPKRAPGRGATKGKAATPPPPNRAANKPRTVSGEPIKPARTYPEKIGELADTLWMITAATPVVQGQFLGRDLHEVTVKVKAQGAILRDQRPALIQGLGMMAEHSAAVRSGIDWISSDGGPGWILPAVFALMPLVAQTAALWRGPIEQAAPLAQRTAAEFAQMAQQMGMVPAAAPNPPGVSGG
jgi:hypothetical protein